MSNFVLTMNKTAGVEGFALKVTKVNIHPLFNDIPEEQN